MIVQKELSDIELANALTRIDEKELFLALEPFIAKTQTRLLKTGRHKPFRPFKAIKMHGVGLTAAEMVIRDRD